MNVLLLGAAFLGIGILFLIIPVWVSLHRLAASQAQRELEFDLLIKQLKDEPCVLLSESELSTIHAIQKARGDKQ